VGCREVFVCAKIMKISTTIDVATCYLAFLFKFCSTVLCQSLFHICSFLRLALLDTEHSSGLNNCPPNYEFYCPYIGLLIVVLGKSLNLRILPDPNSESGFKPDSCESGSGSRQFGIRFRPIGICYYVKNQQVHK
jgi:hypothetical protein